MQIFKHPLSDVQSTNIGKDTKIWQYVVILKDAIIGENCNICSHCFIENDVKIGNNVTVKCGVFIWDGITVEDNVHIGPNVTFVNHNIHRSKVYPEEFDKIYIHEGASLGANSTIKGGVNIGRYALVGAGSVVTKNIPDFTMWYGNPATFKAYICKCGQKINESFTCEFCSLAYCLTDKGIIEKND